MWCGWNSPYINHFTQPDSIIPDQTNPQAWDRYAYVGNNPIRYTDPTGHMMDQGDRGGVAGCSHSIYCRGGRPKPSGELFAMRNQGLHRKNQNATTFATVTPPPTSTTVPSYQMPAATPTPGFTIQPAASTTPTSTMTPAPQLHVDIEINWSQVDKWDVAIDGIGTGADLITIGAVVTGQPEIAIAAQAVGKVDSVIGTIKGGYDLFSNHDTSSLMSQELWRSAEATRLLWRGESNIPIVSIVGNSINLYRDLNPRITITWETP